MNKTIAAWTPAESQPPYVCFEANGDGVLLSVRARPKDGQFLGDVVSVQMTGAEFAPLVRASSLWTRQRENHLASCATFNEAFGDGPNGLCDCRR